MSGAFKVRKGGGEEGERPRMNSTLEEGKGGKKRKKNFHSAS